MKDTRFIELLNLYIDRQITPGDAALLEEEILRHRGRRDIYRQYCRMQRACMLLHDTFRVQAGDGNAAGEARSAAGGVVEFAPRPRRWRPAWIYCAGGLAAAGAVAAALWMLPRREESRLAADPAAAPASTAVASAPPAAAPVQAAGPGRVESFARQSLVVYAPSDLAQGETVLIIEHQPQAVSFDSIEDFVFGRQPVAPGLSHAYRVRSKGDPQLENTAFQFQR